MKTIEAYFEDYSSYHQHRGNQWTHVLGIPMIVVSLLGFLSKVVLFSVIALEINLGLVLLFGAVAWYLKLSWRLGLPFSVVGLGAYFLGGTLSFPLNLGIFILGWIFQFIGHYYFEKKSPAFYKNVEHLLIGPLWVFSKLFGFKKALSNEK
jgi:uncharacterized membrane protein YGL010W